MSAPRALSLFPGMPVRGAALGPWIITDAGDQRVRALADRHYTARPRRSELRSKRKRTVGPPGERLVFVTEDARAAWISLRQEPATVDHAWPGALVCSLFRNEGPTLSSELIVHAVALTVEKWGPIPRAGFITFVDPAKTRARRSRSVLVVLGLGVPHE